MATDSSGSSRNAIKSQLLLLRASFWVGLSAAAITILAASWFTHEFDQIQASAQEQMADVMADGLASVLKNELVLGDLAGIEARLKQSMTSVEVRSALVADSEGHVLSHLVRNAQQQPQAKFDKAVVVLPNVDQMQEKHGTQRVHWVRIEDGGTLGWLRLELGVTEASIALRKLQDQTNTMAALASAVLSLLLILVIWHAYALMRSRENELQEARVALEHLALHDGLTKLPNRHLLMDRLGIAVANADRQGHRLAVCFLDLDGFKQVNDNYGHDAGDDLLCQVARRLEDGVRASETVARVGGDEFVILLAGFADLASCEVILGRLLAAVRLPVQVGPDRVQVGACIGVALYPSPGSSADTLIERADQAMYSAKRAGKNCWRIHGA